MHHDFRTKWLAQLGHRLSMPELAFDQAGLCQLSLDNDLLITIYSPPETAAYLVLFGQLHVAHLSPQLMQDMLINNRNHSRHATPVISLSENLDAVEVHFKVNEAELVATDIFGQLVDCLEYWRGYLA